MLLFPLGVLSLPFGLHVAAVAAPGPASPAQPRAVTQHPALGPSSGPGRAPPAGHRQPQPGTANRAPTGHPPPRSWSTELPQHGREGGERANPGHQHHIMGGAAPAQGARSRTGRRVQSCRCSPSIAGFHSGNANNA